MPLNITQVDVKNKPNKAKTKRIRIKDSMTVNVRDKTTWPQDGQPCVVWLRDESSYNLLTFVKNPYNHEGYEMPYWSFHADGQIDEDFLDGDRYVALDIEEVK